MSNRISLDGVAVSHRKSGNRAAFFILNFNEKLTGNGHVDKDPVFRNDHLKAAASAATYDSNRRVTTLSLPVGQFDAGALASRVIRMGKKWSLVRSNTSRELVVWGQMPNDTLDFEILPSYRLRSGAP